MSELDIPVAAAAATASEEDVTTSELDISTLISAAAATASEEGVTTSELDVPTLDSPAVPAVATALAEVVTTSELDVPTLDSPAAAATTTTSELAVTTSKLEVPTLDSPAAAAAATALAEALTTSECDVPATASEKNATNATVSEEAVTSEPAAAAATVETPGATSSVEELISTTTALPRVSIEEPVNPITLLQPPTVPKPDAPPTQLYSFLTKCSRSSKVDRIEEDGIELGGVDTENGFSEASDVRKSIGKKPSSLDEPPVAESSVAEPPVAVPLFTPQAAEASESSYKKTTSPSNMPQIDIILAILDNHQNKMQAPKNADFEGEKTGKYKMQVPSAELVEADYLTIAGLARQEFVSQPTLLELEAPIVICGDIHGQYRDLLRIFAAAGGPPPHVRYLFLGDYVDRTLNGLEVLSLLMSYKIKYPKQIFLLRGNHECASITKTYGFFDECKRRASVKVWKRFVEAFECMPVAAIVGKRIFCVHGGLSPSLKSMDCIRNLDRPIDISEKITEGGGLVCDLLWSDPADSDEDTSCWKSNPASSAEAAASDGSSGGGDRFPAKPRGGGGGGWATNLNRGVSYTFDRDVVESFIDRFQFDLICRAHQVVEDGYKFSFGRKLVTIFGAPNYCNNFDNAAALLVVDPDLHCSFKIIPAVKRIKLKRIKTWD